MNSKWGLGLIPTALVLLLAYQNCSGFKSETVSAGSNSQTDTTGNGSGSNTGNPPGPGPAPGPVTPPSPTSCATDEILTSFGTCELAAPVSAEAPTISRTVFLSGLNNPWDIAFAPDGTMFFTEKCRGLSVRTTSGTVTRIFGTTGSAVVAADVSCQGQSGVHGIAVDPEFTTNRFVYLFTLSTLNTNPRTNRVLRLKVATDYSSVSERTDIITDIAFKDQGNAVGGAGAHSGGRVRFGPDGYLYVTTGDNHNGPLPQSPTMMGGKVLRVDRNGNAAQGNNAPSGVDPRVYTLGHRNPQGIDFQPITGRAFTSEHGPGHTDEVTPLTAGGNAGWDPRPESGVSCPDNYCGYTTNKANGTLTPMTDTARHPGALPPLWTNNGNSQGMSPTTFLRGRSWKAWHGRLAVGFLSGQRVDVLNIDSQTQLAGVTTMDLPSTRYRALTMGPNEKLYIATDGGQIWEITAQ